MKIKDQLKNFSHIEIEISVYSGKKKDAMFSLKIEKLLIIFTGVHFIDNPLLVAVNKKW